MSLKLIYFQGNGRGYAIRTAFRIGEVPFEDSFITFADLTAAKPASPTYPLGSVPVLQLPSGKIITQSVSLARYAGKKSGLYPENPEEALEVDEIVDIVAIEVVSGAPQHADKEEKKKLREAWAAGKLKIAINYINQKIVSANGGFLVGGKRSIADIYLYALIKGFEAGNIDYVAKEYLQEWPAVIAFAKMYEADSVFGKYAIAI